MAINFYGNLSLDKSEIKNVSLERVSSLPASPSQARIVFKYTSGTAGSLQIYPSTSASQAWLVLDGTGNVDSLSAQNGLVDSAVGQAITISPDYSSSSNIVKSAATGSYANLVLATSKILADESGAVGDYTLFNLQTILGAGVSGVTADNTGAIGITTAATTTSGLVDISATLTASGVPSSATYLKATNTTTLEWDSLPTYNNTTYTLPATSSGSGVSLFGVITLTPSPSGTSDTVNYKGTLNEINVGYTSFGGTAQVISTQLSSTLQITDLEVTTYFNPLGDLDVAGDVTVATTFVVQGSSGNFTAQPVISAVYGDYSSGGQWANVAYVTEVADDFVIYKGGYNATTDTPGLDGLNATQIPVERGWAYAVTTAGDFFSEEVEVGDLLIAEDNFAGGASVLSDWTIVQNKVGLATNSVAGIAKYVSGSGFKDSSMTAGKPELVGYSVTNTGSASVIGKISTSNKGMVTAVTDEPIIITSANIDDSSSTFNAAVQAEYDTNIVSVDVGNNSASTITVNHGLDTLDVFVQLYDNSASNDPNVFAEVVRSDEDNVALTFSSTPTTNQFKVLISAIY